MWFCVGGCRWSSRCKEVKHGCSQAAAHEARRSPSTDFDAIIIGAGVSGLYQLYKLRELGLRVRVFEAGSGVGGTWYWNRYPGARFDSESWTYGYSFSQELLEEWDWEEHFAGAARNRALSELRRRQIRSASRHPIQQPRQRRRITSEETRSWDVELENGRHYCARFLITAVGVLSAATMPNIPGVSRRSKANRATPITGQRNRFDFAGKRVAVIGTGATGGADHHGMAKTVGHLTVFQRTPNGARHCTTARSVRKRCAGIRANYSDIFARCRETLRLLYPCDRIRATALEVTREEREAFWEKLYAEPGFGIWQGNFRDILMDREANALTSDFVARKIRQRVHDPVVAEKLIPKNHGFGTRRVPLETGYFEVYNQPNVKLVDINETPIERITPRGIRTSEPSTASTSSSTRPVSTRSPAPSTASTYAGSTACGSRRSGKTGRRPFSASWWRVFPTC